MSETEIDAVVLAVAKRVEALRRKCVSPACFDGTTFAPDGVSNPLKCPLCHGRGWTPVPPSDIGAWLDAADTLGERVVLANSKKVRGLWSANIGMTLVADKPRDEAIPRALYAALTQKEAHG